jgi:hypothetical protein
MGLKRTIEKWYLDLVDNVYLVTNKMPRNELHKRLDDDAAIRFARSLIAGHDPTPRPLSYAVRYDISYIASGGESKSFKQSLAPSQFLNTLGHALQDDADLFGTTIELSVEIYIADPLGADLAMQLAVLAERTRFPSLILKKVRFGTLSQDALRFIPQIFARSNGIAECDIDVHRADFPLPDYSEDIRCKHLQMVIKSPCFINTRSIAQVVKLFHCTSFTLLEACGGSPHELNTGAPIEPMPDIRHIEMSSAQDRGYQSRILALIRACPNLQSIKVVPGSYDLRAFLQGVVRNGPNLRAVHIEYGITHAEGPGRVVTEGLADASGLVHLRINANEHPGPHCAHFVRTHPRLATFMLGRHSFDHLNSIITYNKDTAFTLATLVADGEMDPDLIRCLVPYIFHHE